MLSPYPHTALFIVGSIALLISHSVQETLVSHMLFWIALSLIIAGFCLLHSRHRDITKARDNALQKVHAITLEKEILSFLLNVGNKPMPVLCSELEYLQKNQACLSDYKEIFDILNERGFSSIVEAYLVHRSKMSRMIMQHSWESRGML